MDFLVAVIVRATETKRKKKKRSSKLRSKKLVSGKVKLGVTIMLIIILGRSVLISLRGEHLGVIGKLSFLN